MTLMEAKMNYIRAWQTLPEYGLTYFIIKLQGSKKEVCSMHCIALFIVIFIMVIMSFMLIMVTAIMITVSLPLF